MGVVITDDKNYKDIANAIRSKSGTTGQLKPSQMASAIDAIDTGGSGINVLKKTGTVTTDDSGHLEITTEFSPDVVIFIMDEYTPPTAPEYPFRPQQIYDFAATQTSDMYPVIVMAVAAGGYFNTALIKYQTTVYASIEIYIKGKPDAVVWANKNVEYCLIKYT